jgi:hypothetical protein
VDFLDPGGTPEQFRAHAAAPEHAKLQGDATGFVQGLYHAVPGRLGSADELNFYTQQLAGGTSRSKVAAEFINRLEHRLVQTQGIYQELLRRDADQAGPRSNAPAPAGGRATPT